MQREVERIATIIRLMSIHTVVTAGMSGRTNDWRDVIGNKFTELRHGHCRGGTVSSRRGTLCYAIVHEGTYTKYTDDVMVVDSRIRSTIYQGS